MKAWLAYGLHYKTYCEILIDCRGHSASRDCVVGPLLERWAREQPQRNFLEFSDGTAWTFADMRSARAACGRRAARRLGVDRGSHVLSWMPNEREAILGWFGANLLGAVYVPLNTAYRGAILRHAVALSDAKVMIAHASLLPRLEPESASLLEHIVCAAVRRPPSTGRACTRSTCAGAAWSAEAGAAGAAVGCELHHPDLGHDRAVEGRRVHVHPGVGRRRDGDGLFRPGRRLLANLPLFHVSGVGAVMDRSPRAARACCTTASSRSRSGTRCAASTSPAAAWSAR